MRTKRSNLVVWAFAVAAVLGVGLCGANRAAAATLGMVADNASTTKSVTVFDADTDVVLGSVALPGGGLAIGDCVISADQTRGFVTTFGSKIWVIDLTTAPPSLAAGPNPIFISNPGEDSAISPDGKFLLTCDATSTLPISVIDIATQTQIGTFFLGSDCNSVDVCSDGSVLVTSFNIDTVRRLTIDGAGTLTDTGESAPHTDPVNVYCAPGAASGVVLRVFPAHVRSFTIPGLGLVDERWLAAPGVSGLIHPDGSRIFTRSRVRNWVDVFTYNSATAAIGATPILSIPVGSVLGFFGMDQMALHPDGVKLYVPELGVLNVYDANTGVLLTSITDANISAPTGVDIADGPAGFPVNFPPIANAGPDQTAACTGGGAATVTLDGSGSINPDGLFSDIVDFEWREGLTVLAAGASPTANVSLAVGPHTITLTVTDTLGASGNDNVVITVEDTTPPLITAPAALTIECTGLGTAVALGSPVASDTCALAMVTNNAPALFPVGTTLVTWIATDTGANSATDTQLVTVEDTTPPTLTVSVTPEVLWPPTHQLIEITPTITVADACDAAPTVELLSITMSEGDLTLTYDPDFDTTLSQGQTMDDIVVDSEGRIFLRAERAGAPDGRVYTLTYEAVDGSMNSTTASATVTVPRLPPSR